MRTYELAKLTWKEAEEALAEKPVVLIPIGAVEPHGLQLPLGTDYMVAEYVALRAAEESGAALLTPTIPFGYCDSVEDVPGAISFNPDTLSMVIKDVVSNLARHGVERIIFVNNHRSNSVALGYVARKLRRELDIEMATFFPWGTIQAFCPPMYEDFAAVFGHGGEPETSVMQSLFPEHVRMDLAKPDQYEKKWGIPAKSASQLDFDGTPIEVYLQTQEISGTGTRGNPLEASADRGNEMIDQVIDRLVNFIRVFKDVPLPND
ncbi:MAG: creatininase family protein [Bacillota bacterium]|jgi:creatinine amidohydrolase